MSEMQNRDLSKQVYNASSCMCYFGDKGLTMTSANHIANLAKQSYQKDESFLKELNLVSTNIQVIGQEVTTPSSVGATIEDLQSIDSRLNNIAQCKGFIAWLREAIKAKEELQNCIHWFTFELWLKANDLKLPELNNGGYITAYSELNVAEKASMLLDEAKAATFGSFIHPDGPLDKAYKHYIQVQSNKLNVNIAGRDTIITHYEPSIADSEVVENTLDSIRAEWRETEAKFNKRKYDLDKTDQARERSSRAEAEASNRARAIRENELREQYHQWVDSELDRIDSLKIVIPEMFKPLYEHLKSLGKK